MKSLNALGVWLLVAMLLLVAVPATPISAQAPEILCCPSPVYNLPIVVNGNIGDWAGVTVFANLYRAGDPCKPVEAYLRLVYNCRTHTMYILVLSKDGMPVQQDLSETWVKVDLNPNKVVFSSFAWVMDGSVAIGWEASFPLSEATHFIKVHTNVWDEGQWQTSSTCGVCVSLDCPPTSVTVSSYSVKRVRYGIKVIWETASEVNNLGFEIRRSTVRNYSTAKKIKFVASKSPGGMVGAKYQWTNRYDSSTNPVLSGVRYHYWLVAVETSGQKDVFYVGSAVWSP